MDSIGCERPHLPCVSQNLGPHRTEQRGYDPLARMLSRAEVHDVDIGAKP